MKHVYAAPPPVALVLAAAGCFGTITVGEKITTAPGLAGAASGPIDPAAPLDDSGPLKPAAYDPYQERVALRVRSYLERGDQTMPDPLTHVIYEGDVSGDGMRARAERKHEATQNTKPRAACKLRGV